MGSRPRHRSTGKTSWPYPSQAVLELSEETLGWYLFLRCDSEPTGSFGPFETEEQAKNFLVWLAARIGQTPVETVEGPRLATLDQEELIELEPRIDPWEAQREAEHRRRRGTDLYELMRDTPIEPPPAGP